MKPDALAQRGDEIGLAHDGQASTLRALLGPAREEAFEAGHAPLLAAALETRAAHVLSAERVGAYLNILYALLLLRRGHELEPLHDDLFDRVVGPQRVREPDYTSERFAADIAQLVAWGAIERHTEAQKLRGYRDNRRQRYRYRLHTDAIALIEWLEARLAARLEGRMRDSRDLLADVVGALKEARRVLGLWRRRDDDDAAAGDALELARRAIYLLESMAEAASAISGELLSFRAEMLAFASRPYDISALREILTWLERYVAVYLSRVHELRTEIRDRLAELAQPRYRRALGECRDALEVQRAATPRAFRGDAPLRTPDELIDAQIRFFMHHGRLSELCGHIDTSTSTVALKMHRHLAELERRNQRRQELRASIRYLAKRPDAADFAELLNRLVASAHGRFAGRVEHAAKERIAPPAPRVSAVPAPSRVAGKPLRRKSLSPESARDLRARRDHALRLWLREEVLAAMPAGASAARLSALALASAEAPRRWLDVARARYLGKVSLAERLGVHITAAPGHATLGSEEQGLLAPDCEIEPVEAS